MRKEFGKWLLDIAKYMVTALMLSSVFTDLESPIIFSSLVVIVIFLVILGLSMLNDNK